MTYQPSVQPTFNSDQKRVIPADQPSQPFVFVEYTFAD